MKLTTNVNLLELARNKAQTQDRDCRFDAQDKFTRSLQVDFYLNSLTNTQLLRLLSDSEDPA